MTNRTLLVGMLAGLDIDSALLKAVLPLVKNHTNVRFDGSVFTDGIYISEEFHGKASFNHCRFEKRAYFDGSEFHDTAYFVSAEFVDDVSFNGTTFHGEARFDLATFHAGATFGSEFEDQVRFDRSLFEKYGVITVRAGNTIRFDGASCSSLVVNAKEALNSGTSERAAGGSAAPPALLLFRETKFCGPSSIRSRADIDVAFPGINLADPLTITAWRGRVRVLSIRGAVLSAPLVLGPGVDVGACRMSEAVGLSALHFTNADPGWQEFRGRRVVADELELRGLACALPSAPDDVATELVQRSTITATLVESIYRQLRAAQENSKASHAAADFYYGEMEMRRTHAARLSGEWIVLAIYRAIAGYGVRAGRPLVTFLTLILLAGLALRFTTGFWIADPAKVTDSSGLSFTHYLDCVAVTLRYSVSFLGGGIGGLTSAGTILMFVLRLAGPTTFALIVLALRSRVQR